MAKKVDGNQAAIVGALRKVGCSVALTHMVADGFPDLVVGVNRKNFLMEIKDENQPPSKRKLTPAQVEFHERWRGQIVVVESVAQAIDFINNNR